MDMSSVDARVHRSVWLICVFGQGWARIEDNGIKKLTQMINEADTDTKVHFTNNEYMALFGYFFLLFALAAATRECSVVHCAGIAIRCVFKSHLIVSLHNSTLVMKRRSPITFKTTVSLLSRRRRVSS